MTESGRGPPLHSPPVPESTPPAPPPVFGRDEIRKKTRQRTTQRLLRVGVIAAVVVVVIAGSAIGYVEYRNHQITRIKVGGNVQGAKIVKKIPPVYPQLAKSARVSGVVHLAAIIAKDGTIQELQYVSGPALLMRAAMDAVHEWRYHPTMLNGEPVEVDTTIDVVFSLGGG